MVAYNLFRRKGCEALCCAVPEHFPVPGFLGGTNWTVAGRIEPGASAPIRGFDQSAAKAVIALSGFYLFQEEAEASSPYPDTARLREQGAAEEQQFHPVDPIGRQGDPSSEKASNEEFATVKAVP